MSSRLEYPRPLLPRSLSGPRDGSRGRPSRPTLQKHKKKENGPDSRPPEGTGVLGRVGDYVFTLRHKQLPHPPRWVYTLLNFRLGRRSALEGLTDDLLFSFDKKCLSSPVPENYGNSRLSFSFGTPKTHFPRLSPFSPTSARPPCTCLDWSGAPTTDLCKHKSGNSRYSTTVSP